MLKYLESPSWDYPLRVAAALRSAGWPTPAPVSEPLVVPGGAWVLFDRLPGAPRAGGDRPRERGRLLAALHLAAAASGIDSPRDGFPPPAEVVGDPSSRRCCEATPGNTRPRAAFCWRRSWKTCGRK